MVRISANTFNPRHPRSIIMAFDQSVNLLKAIGNALKTYLGPEPETRAIKEFIAVAHTIQEIGFENPNIEKTRQETNKIADDFIKKYSNK